MNKEIIILGIESSCDDTSAAVTKGRRKLSNIIAGQDVHRVYGGVVPELASRAHQQNIIPVVDTALKRAGVTKNDLDAIAYTRGPGLLGSLLVGASFAKGLALSLNIPLIEVNHMQAHILAHFIKEKDGTGVSPELPFLCLTVSGGHTQIVRVTDHYTMKVIGKTLDDAAGEAFDKIAKVMGLPYPGGPLIDKYAQKGNPEAFDFPEPAIPGLDFSFSGLKTAFLYFIRDKLKENPNFITENVFDLAASVQRVIVNTLMNKLKKAVRETGIKRVAIAGGVSANSALRAALKEAEMTLNWEVFVPAFEYCTDNAAMIAITGYYKYLKKEFSSQQTVPNARLQYFEVG